MCGTSAYGGRQAKGSGETIPEFEGSVYEYSGFEEEQRMGYYGEGVVPWVGYHGHEGGAVYGHSVPHVGGYEEVGC